MAVEIYADQAFATVISGGTVALAPGTAETWIVASAAALPAVSSSASPPTQCHIYDTASGFTGESVLVTNIAGTSPGTLSVTRGAENSAPVAHLSPFQVAAVAVAGGMNSLFPSPSGTAVAGYVPVAAGAGQVSAWTPVGSLSAATTSARGVIQLNGTVSAIQPVGTVSAAGVTGNAADAGHAHLGYAQVATTGQAGVALINGTQTFLSWTAPADGNMHVAAIYGVMAIGNVTETGGAIGVGATFPNGATGAAATQLFAANQTANTTPSNNVLRLIQSGSTITVAQTSALSAGGPGTLYATMFAL